jgi:hypothetical protein
VYDASIEAIELPGGYRGAENGTPMLEGGLRENRYVPNRGPSELSTIGGQPSRNIALCKNLPGRLSPLGLLAFVGDLHYR